MSYCDADDAWACAARSLLRAVMWLIAFLLLRDWHKLSRWINSRSINASDTGAKLWRVYTYISLLALWQNYKRNREARGPLFLCTHILVSCVLGLGLYATYAEMQRVCLMCGYSLICEILGGCIVRDATCRYMHGADFISVSSLQPEWNYILEGSSQFIFFHRFFF